MSKRITLANLAPLAGCTHRALKKAALAIAVGKRKTWRGAALVIHRVHGRGGLSGWSYEVEIDSLPEPLQGLLKACDRPVQLTLPLRQDDAASAERRERIAIIGPIVAHPAGSAERRAALRTVLETPIFRDGKHGKLPERTVRNWVKDFDEGGELALQRKRRKDAGQAAVEITRRWDRMAAGLPEEKRVEIRMKLDKFLFSRWGEGCSFGVVKRLGEERLAKLTREAGCTLSAGELAPACALPKHLVERGRNDGRKVFTRRRDAKGHDDRLPRMRLTHQGYAPSGLVYGDVHHVDVLVPRGDGTFATPKAIAWLDGATRRLRIVLVLCEPGTSIRNADVIQAFIELTQDPEWGVPSRLYLDNGSEYNFADFLADPLKLANMGCTAEPVSRARAYNPAAKGALEGAFRNLERLLVPMIGSIPGNRMITRSANLGKAPTAYPGTFEDFARDFYAALAFYNTQPQKGDLGGISPVQAFRKAVAAGWTRVDVDGDALRTAFSVTEHRTVSRGKIHVGGEVLYCDGLAALDGERVRIQRPKYLSWDGVAVYDKRNVFIGVAHLDEARDPLDRDSAAESARRRRVAFDASAELVREIDDEKAVQLMAENSAARIRHTAPASAGRIVLAPEAEQIARETNGTPRQRANSKATEAQKRQEARLALLEKMGNGG